jgi:hypothetical protein
MECRGGVQGHAAVMQRVRVDDRGRPGQSTTRPRAIEGAHPDHILSVRNAVTPSGSGPWSGKPTVRNA